MQHVHPCHVVRCLVWEGNPSIRLSAPPSGLGYPEGLQRLSQKPPRFQNRRRCRRARLLPMPRSLLRRLLPTPRKLLHHRPRPTRSLPLLAAPEELDRTDRQARARRMPWSPRPQWRRGLSVAAASNPGPPTFRPAEHPPMCQPAECPPTCLPPGRPPTCQPPERPPTCRPPECPPWHGPAGDGTAESTPTSIVKRRTPGGLGMAALQLSRV
jgi:hypothetical protein